MSKSTQFEEDVLKRMEDIDKADIGQPESEAFRSADAALHDLIATTAMQKAVAALAKTRVLITVAVSAVALRIISALHPNFELVVCAFGKPIGAEIEAMRDAVVCALSEKIYMDGHTMIHVGGSASQHIPYGRDVHCEYPAFTVSSLGGKTRRHGELLAMYKEIDNVNKTMGSSCLKYQALHKTLTETPCNPSLCARPAASMLFDILAVPMSQTQVCSSMIMHDADEAEIMLPVETQSLGGAAGMIPGTDVKAVYDATTDYINYDVKTGAVEFPPTPRAIVIEYLHKAVVQLNGSTFKFELQEDYGFFRRVNVVRIRENVDMDVTHSIWAPDQVGMTRVTVPRLRRLGLDPTVPANYYEASASVKTTLFNAAFSYAMTLERKVLSVSLIRTKIASINDRVVVKGTSVELNDSLDQTVLDIVSLGVFLVAYEERYRSSEGFRAGAAEVQRLHTHATGSFVGVACRLFVSYMAETSRGVLDAALEPALEKLDEIYLKSAHVSNVTVRSEVLRTDFRTVVFKRVRSPQHWFSYVVNDNAPGAHLTRLWLKMKAVAIADPRQMTEAAMDVYDDSLSKTQRHGVEPSAGSGTFELEMLDPLPTAGGKPEEDIEHLVDAARTLMAHTDAGPDDSGDLRYDRVRTVDQVVNIPYAPRGLVGYIDSPLEILDETYMKIFPAVALADMSQDLELFEESKTDFALNCYYMRFPVDMFSPPAGPRYYSRLNGPNRPNARPTSKNMLTGMIKRNADANTLKIAEYDDLSYRVWENFKRTYCRDDIEDHLIKLRAQPLREAFPHFMGWLESADGRKVTGAMKELMASDEQLHDLPLNEFVAMFKGQCKPTLSSSAHTAYAKFQTIVYYDDKRINALWSPIMRDIAARFESCLAPQVFVALRGDRVLRENHLSQYWPYGANDMAYIQVDISEYDKSQESRTRHLEDLIFRELGMPEEYIKNWSYNHIDTTIRVLGLGIKMVVAYQRKSGDATTALGNVMLNMMASAYAFGKPTVSISQGDDGLIIRPFGGLDVASVSETYAQLFNLPVKLIVQTSCITSIPYAMSCFYVPDIETKRVYVVPDPVRAVESHSKALSSDDDKFQEKWVSYQDRVRMWRAPYPMRDFARMLQEWYSCPTIDVERFMTALVSQGKDAKTYRSIWEDALR